MKRFSLFAALMVCFMGMSLPKAAAQSSAPYHTAFGLFLDLGNGGTYVGPHVKHFFSGNDAGQAMVLFGNDITILGVEYSYNKEIPDAKGLMWNLGIGPQAFFGDGETVFAIRPMAGLEFKVPQAPIAIGFDWRPAWAISDGSEFEAGRFGLSFKYTL
ncbi:hypothetical protein H8S90_03480 [Olivibacter sp. SDN3]|uniref:hypothetical protein n=1 Tax=Olivibacter sp. SDN3 TaxID=2764720 RepID=UPI0016518B68|nr:hypothetical protein [Olivibacter sp. SDN3]QNL50674.1 hypothetical protein H8S90_03480 [Olivibacter sp. SDN3]